MGRSFRTSNHIARYQCEDETEVHANLLRGEREPTELQIQVEVGSEGEPEQESGGEQGPDEDAQEPEEQDDPDAGQAVELENLISFDNFMPIHQQISWTRRSPWSSRGACCSCPRWRWRARSSAWADSSLGDMYLLALQPLVQQLHVLHVGEPVVVARHQMHWEGDVLHFVDGWLFRSIHFHISLCSIVIFAKALFINILRKMVNIFHTRPAWEMP